ncbi:hypothetical protein EVB41_062 [Rhizobium phage RHph_TM3_14A]|nr:hypothetical protein EVB31_061 [Rhizobium phage RHph_TM29]QIG67527.1 hypothetical protein EVB41_062 [Rhizobium phage RHph_TM3_14A]
MQNTLALPERDTEHERVLGIVFELSPGQASVLSCLVRGAVAKTDELLEYSGLAGPMKVVIFRTREKMRTHGVFIRSKINVGYWIDGDDKKKVEKAVAKFLGNAA